MLGFAPIGSQAVGESNYGFNAVEVVIITAAGRASGSSTVFASGASIFTSSGRSLGKSVVVGTSGVVTEGITAATKIVFTFVATPFAFEFTQAEPKYKIDLY